MTDEVIRAPLRGFVRAAGALGAVGVALGAFGAHGLRDRLPPSLLEVWKTAVLYHLLHAVALLAIAASGRPRRGVRVAAWAWMVGIAVFSGSLYALALTGRPLWGAVTPVGGVAFIAGWAAVFVTALDA